MFDTSPDYRTIFEQRGASYDAAMQLQPAARDQEFRRIVALAQPGAGSRVLDAPSGGGYLSRYLPTGCRIVAVDPANQFSDRAHASGVTTTAAALDQLPFADASFDCIISLAGLHHESSRGRIFREWARCLHPDGCLCAADVASGSPVAAFLDGFVDAHNPAGHEGDYFNDATLLEVRESGLTITRRGIQRYRWYFDNPPQAAEYCRRMFGIVADDDTVLQGLHDTVGTRHEAGGCFSFGWELLFIRAELR